MDGRGLNDIRDHIGASATAANILVQMTNDPLDVIISFQEAYQERTVRSFLSAALSMVPFVPGSIIRKGDDLADLGKAEEMAKAEAGQARRTATAYPPKPEWLQQVESGVAFDQSQAEKYPFNEIYIEKKGGGYVRLDSYNPDLGEIVSRKMTQFDKVQTSTAVQYLKELASKYASGSRIADVPSSGSLAGRRLHGQLILEIPVQLGQIPLPVLDAANRLRIILRDTMGNVY